VATVFISDLHLSRARPEKVALLRRLLERSAGRVEALYILGDLFELWLGDDDDTMPHSAVVAALRHFSAGGTPLYLMHGNRDFLVGERFALAAGCTLLSDPHAANLYGTRALLMHGDLLCTQDIDYQAFRRKVRDPRWQQWFLAKPLWLRKLMGHMARLRSRLASRGKPASIMDVEQTTVLATMREHSVALLIHGHTHRPGIHDFELDGSRVRRIVLGDWYEQDSVLVCEARGQRLLRVTDYLEELQ
jgi:UDP-2,3-diacylglucosamine hydrolase